jgi:hypothetical protein
MSYYPEPTVTVEMKKHVKTGLFKDGVSGPGCWQRMGSRNQQKRKCLPKAVPHLMRLVAGFPPRCPGFDPRSGHVGFVVDRVALGQIFSENLGFLCQSF